MKPGEFFALAVPAALESGHPYPEYAVCEAALESGWSESQLAREANNLFGQKQGSTTAGCPVVTLPTREYYGGQWVTVAADWPRFATWQESFAARLKLLQSNPSYNRAFAASTGEEFVRQVSKVWATDPARADKVLAIYRVHREEIEALIAAHTPAPDTDGDIAT